MLAIVECQPVQATLQQAKEAGLKIYGVVGNDCDIPEVGGTAMFDGAIFKAVPGGPTAMTKDTATARAAWVTSVGGDSAQIIEMTEPDYMGVTIASAAFHDALAEVCAGCAVSEVPFNLTDLYGPELRAKTEAGLLQNPDANVITFPYDTALLLGGAVPQVRAWAGDDTLVMIEWRADASTLAGETYALGMVERFDLVAGRVLAARTYLDAASLVSAVGTHLQTSVAGRVTRD